APYISGSPSDTWRLLGGHLRQGASCVPVPHRTNAGAKPGADTVGASREIVLVGASDSPVCMEGPCTQKTVGFLARIADRLDPALSDTKTQRKKQGTIAPLSQVFGRMERYACSSVISACQKVTAPRSWTSNRMPSAKLG